MNIILIVKMKSKDEITIDVVDYGKGKFLEQVDWNLETGWYNNSDRKAEAIYALMDHYNANQIIFDEETVSVNLIKAFNEHLDKKGLALNEFGYVTML